jgi:uncharacterized protein (UPF0332 family)
MINENMKALVAYRLEQADESLQASQLLLEKGLIRPSLNRAYYAMFYAVLALLATRQQETVKHSGAISLFDKEFVRNGTFAKERSRWLHDAFNLRQRSDYAIEIEVKTEKAEEILQHAGIFVADIKANLAKLIENQQT